MMTLLFVIPGDGAFWPKRQTSKKRLVLDGFMTPLHLEVYPWGYLGTRARGLGPLRLNFSSSGVVRR